MEFLLINHPLDCPICDQAGECSLQEYSVEHGRGLHRASSNSKVKKPKNVDIGPRIRLDDERCIMCSRCIRFMDEVADDPVLGFIDRGTHTKLTVHPGQTARQQLLAQHRGHLPGGRAHLERLPLPDAGLVPQGNQEHRRQLRHRLQHHVIWTRGERIYRITPRENNEVNSCWMPDSHRLNFHYLTRAAAHRP